MPTVYDVARVAQVSKSTVSLVINDSPLVSDKTRDRVLAAIEEIGYRPSRIARSLVTQKTRMLGLIYSDALNPFFHEVISDMESIAKEHDYIFMHFQLDTVLEENRIFNALQERQVDGAICLTTAISDDAIDGLCSQKIPLVVYNRKFRQNKLVSGVQIDCAQAIGDAASALARHGHREVGFLGAYIESYSTASKLDVYRRQMEAAGLSLPDCYLWECTGTADGGYKSVKAMLQAGSYPTAIVACNDMLAMGAMRAIREQELSIPGDISVIGFDDIAISRLMTPPLSTISVDKNQISHAAFSLVMDMIGGTPGREMVVQAEFMERESTGPALVL
jgi:LacI family transcriptional regulator